MLYSVLLLLLIAAPGVTFATNKTLQAHRNAVYEDSARTRNFQSWRIGLTGGASLLLENGFVQFPDFPPDTKNIPLSFTGKISGGWFVQTFARWQPEFFPFVLSLALGLDKRTSILSAPTPEQGSILALQSSHSLMYATCSPSFIIPIPIFLQPFSLIGGIGADFLLSSSTQPLVSLTTPGAPEQEYNTALQPAFLRWNVSVGIGYTITEPLQTMPNLELFPTLTIQAGSGIITESGNTWNHIALRFSLSASIPFLRSGAPPEIQTIAPMPPIAEVHREALSNAVRQWLSIPGLPPVASLVKTENTITAPNVTGEENQPSPAIPDRSVLQPHINTPQNFEYQTAKETRLNPSMKIYLDLVAQLMKTQHQLTLRIIGHTDNSGTRRDKQLISEARALAAVRYLQNKGIVRTRIFDTGVGDRQPIADNGTESGRSKNRRLEILLLER